jgi:ABC-type sugar transport system ATPase subunit
MKVLEAVNISKSFDQHQVLKNIGFKLEAGKTIVFLGKSGCGKSTLLKIIAGLLSPDKGEIYVNQIQQAQAHHKLLPGNDTIKLVNQDYQLDAYHTVEENIRLKILHLKQEEQIKLLKELVQIFELKHILHKKAIEISGGEQQRLAIARAIATKPAFLLLDEPFSHLNQALKIKIENYLRCLKKERKMALILVTHDGLEALSWADEIIYLKNTTIQRRDTPKNFYENPSNLEEGRFFGALNEVTFKGKQKRFRPEAYQESKSKNALNIYFQSVRYLGSYYLNYGTTENFEKVVLTSKKPLPKKISILPK